MLVAMAELRGMQDDRWIEGPIFDRAVRLDRAKALIELLKERCRDVELSLAESMEEDQIIVPGIGRLTRGKSYSSTWKHEDSSKQLRADLADAVAREVSLDVATGDMDPMKRNVALAALRVAYDAIPAFSSLKVAGRDRLHLDIADYRSFQWFSTVSIERAGES